MNSDESLTQKPQNPRIATPVDDEPNLPASEAIDRLPSEATEQPFEADESPTISEMPEEPEPQLSDEDSEISLFFEEVGARGESEEAMEQIQHPQDSQPTAIDEMVTDIQENVTENLAERVQALQQQEQDLTEKIATLEAEKVKALAALGEAQVSIGRLVQDGLIQLEQRKQTLQIEVEKLERRRDRIQKELRTTFAGVSQDLAIRVQGFKDYLVGSLQDLAATAEL